MKEKLKLNILLFIPAKDEAATVGQVITETKAELQKIVQNFSILVIDDGSSDDTEIIAKQQGAHTIKHHTNRGLGYSFQEAVDYAIQEHFDYMITIDADNQFNPAEIPLLLSTAIDKQADMVTGSRFMQNTRIENMSAIKLWGNRRMSNLINSILGTSFHDVSCGFRIYSREALLHLSLSGNFTYTQEVFLNLGYKLNTIAEVPIQVRYFPERKSRVASSIIGYAKRTFGIIFSSVLHYNPFRIFGRLSFLLFIMSLIILSPITYRYIDYSVVSPYKGVAILGILLACLSFISLIVGIILHTLGKIHLKIDQVLYYEKRKL